jgi:ATPase subunit of ABC transporter with duplicated ATPase domains
MGKADANDSKKADKKAKKADKKAKKEAKKEAKRIRKEKKRREEEARRESKQEQPESTLSLHDASAESLRSSVFYSKRIEVSLSLLPVSMGNIMAALENSIRSMILKYTDKVGILLTFQNIKIISNNGHGRILNDLPHIHYRVSFDGLVFSPTVNSKVSFLVSLIWWL